MMFKTRKPKGFAFKPRVYDERKEELEKRRKRVELDEREPGSIGDAVRLARLRRGQHVKSNRRIAIIACILALLVYLVLR